MHLAEKPIALNTCWLANVNRGSDKPPFSIDDFYWFAPAVEDTVESVPADVGAAAMALVARDAFPTFALGEWFDDMKRAAVDHPAPKHLAWIAEDAILLAPRRTDPDHWTGYFIVMDEAAGQLREFRSEDDRREWMLVPSSVGSGGAVEAHVETSLLIVESAA